MKVIHFVHNYYGFSGASKQARNISAALDRINNIKPVFFNVGVKSGSCPDSEDVIINSSPILFRRVFSFFKMIYKFRPDIIHFHGADFALLLVAKAFGIKVYWKTTLYGSDDFKSLTVGKFGFIKKCLIGFIDFNNTLTCQIKRVNANFLSEEKLVTIPNGVEIPLNGFKNKEKLVLIVAAIIPRKGVLEGIRFYNKNMRKDGYKLVIIGPCDDHLDGFSSSYQTEFISLLDSDILYLGEVSSEVVRLHLNNARFLIHLSKSEGMPNIVLESLAHGVYPITLDMDGLASELYEHEKSGFCIDSEDSEFNLSDCESFNMAGYERVNNLNHFAVISNKTFCVYDSLLSGNEIDI